jgi:tetratricopeptide (TPR) repeat protein
MGKEASVKTSVGMAVLGIAMLFAPCRLCFGQEGNNSLLKGAEYAAEGKFAEAREQYSKVSNIDPLLPDVEAAVQIIDDAEQQRIRWETAIYLFKGIDHFQKGNNEEALAEFSKAVSLNPGYAMAYNMRGAVYGSKGEYDKAIADLDTAIQISPGSPLPYINRGFTYKLRRQPDRAIVDYDKAIKIRPNYAVIYYDRALANESKGERDRAISDYNKAIQISPRYADAYYNRASVYVRSHQYEKAIVDLSTYIEIRPGASDGYNNRGIIYLNNFADREKGCLDLKRACELGECGAYEEAKKQGACEYLHVN